MSDWWLSRGDGKTEGPLTTQALVQGLIAGQIPKRSHICKVGDQTWVRVSQVDEIWEAANPEQIKTNVTERPWFLSTPELPSAPATPAHEADRARVLTPQPTVDAATGRQTFTTPLPIAGTHRELFARQAQQPSKGSHPTEPQATPVPAGMRPKVPTLTGIVDPSAERVAPISHQKQGASPQIGQPGTELRPSGVPAAPVAAPASPGLSGLQALGAPQLGSAMPGLPALGSIGQTLTRPNLAHQTPLTTDEQIRPIGPATTPSHTASATPDGHVPLAGTQRFAAPPTRTESSVRTPVPLQGSALRAPVAQHAPVTTTPARAAAQHSPVPAPTHEPPNRLSAPRGSPMGLPRVTGPGLQPAPLPSRLAAPGVLPVPPPAGTPTPVLHPAPFSASGVAPAPSITASRTSPTRPSSIGSAEDEERTTVVHSPFVKSSEPPTKGPERLGFAPAAGGAPKHLSDLALPEDDDKTTITRSTTAASASAPQADDDDEKTTIAKSPYVVGSPPQTFDKGALPTKPGPQALTAASASAHLAEDDEKTTIAKSPYFVTAKSSAWDEHSGRTTATAPADPARRVLPSVTSVKRSSEEQATRPEAASGGVIERGSTNAVASSQDDDETHLIRPKPQVSLKPPAPHRSSPDVGAHLADLRRSAPKHDIPAATKSTQSGLGLLPAPAPSDPKQRVASSPKAAGADDPYTADLLLSDPSQLMEECYDEPGGAAIHPAPVLPLERTKPAVAALESASPVAVQAVHTPPSTPPPARRPRLPSAPSIVFKHEPLDHQEATQPAARILRELQARKPRTGRVVLVLVFLIVAAAAAYYFFVGTADWR